MAVGDVITGSFIVDSYQSGLIRPPEDEEWTITLVSNSSISSSFQIYFIYDVTSVIFFNGMARSGYWDGSNNVSHIYTPSMIPMTVRINHDYYLSVYNNSLVDDIEYGYYGYKSKDGSNKLFDIVTGMTNPYGISYIAPDVGGEWIINSITHNFFIEPNDLFCDIKNISYLSATERSHIDLEAAKASDYVTIVNILPVKNLGLRVTNDRYIDTTHTAIYTGIIVKSA